MMRKIHASAKIISFSRTASLGLLHKAFPTQAHLKGLIAAALEGIRKATQHVNSPSPVLGACGIEAWVCYSSISLFLYYAYKQQAEKPLVLFVAKGSPSLREDSELRSRILSHSGLKTYTALSLLKLCLFSRIRGGGLVVRVPHQNPPTYNKYLDILRWLRFLDLQIYDDGFLGILEVPVVCSYLHPIFTSIVTWDIAGWNPSPFTLRAVSKDCNLLAIRLPMTDIALKWRAKLNETVQSRIFVIESKYMDYSYLPEFLHSSKALRRGPSFNQIPEYFEHPWEIKRNPRWPNELERVILKKDPLERYLTANISDDSMVVAGMTSTIIWVCELAKKRILPKFSLAILLCEDGRQDEFHNQSESVSFLNFLITNYRHCVKIFASVNRQIAMNNFGNEG